jgi:hypothetical protein
MLSCRVPLLVLAAIALGAWGQPAGATSVAAKGLRDLTAEADAIFVATVSQVQSRWVDDRRSGIETLVTFTDVMPLLGAAEDELTLRFSGGSVDGVREEFVGVPRFAPGERVVLFTRQGHRVSPVVGFSQGCFRVLEGPSGPVVVTAEGRPVHEVGGEHVDAGGAAGETADAAAEAMPLAEFIESVERMLVSTGRSGS